MQELKKEEIKFLYIANTSLVIDKKKGITVAAGGIINPLLFNLRTLINLEFSGHAKKVAVLSDKEKLELIKKFEDEYEICQLGINSLPEKQIEEIQNQKPTDLSNQTENSFDDNDNFNSSTGDITDEVKADIVKIFLSKKAGVKKIAEQFAMSKEDVKSILAEKGLA